MNVFSSGGAFLDRFGGIGIGRGEFDCPVAVAVSAGGDIAVVDHSNARVQIL